MLLSEEFKRKENCRDFWVDFNKHTMGEQGARGRGEGEGERGKRKEGEVGRGAGGGGGIRCDSCLSCYTSFLNRKCQGKTYTACCHCRYSRHREGKNE